jgi:hypothetical protein
VVVQQVVLVVLGPVMFVTHIYPLVMYFLDGPLPTSGTVAPMFWTIVAVLGVFLVLAARNPNDSLHRAFATSLNEVVG